MTPELPDRSLTASTVAASFARTPSRSCATDVSSASRSTSAGSPDGHQTATARTGSFRRRASCKAHARASSDDGEPSTPTTSPVIATGISIPASRAGRQRSRYGEDTDTTNRGRAMKVAIIGAGNVGGAVAQAVTAAGHEVVVSASHAQHAQALADKVGGAAAESNAAAARDADVVVLAVPYDAVNAVATEIGDVAAGKVIVDATNPLKADSSGLAVTDRSGAELLQDRLPGASVVKAFNTVFASNQAEPVVDGVPLDGFVAGDDAAAKARVADLLTAIGYRPVDAGGLAAARALEHMAFLNISLNANNNWSWRSGWKLVGPTG